jgi:hypothetical protein
MAVNVSYPGVYVDEDTSVSLSIGGSSTAVPIIQITGQSGFNSPVKFNNYIEFINFIGGWVDQCRYFSVRAYFECGGGPCYVLNQGRLQANVPLYDDITLIVAAGLSIDGDLTKLCYPGSGRFAILDGPSTEITNGTAADSLPNSSCAAAYYPFLSVNWTGNRIPPSVVMAALYCSVDRTRGVWKAPANIALPGNYKPVFKVTDDLQAQYTSGKAINMIRALDSRGPVVWGARTLEDSDDWRYIPVRRFFDSAERDIKNAMQTMVFEPNNQPTWEKVRSAITNYLYSLWRQGALVGATEQDAYFVQIGKDITMTDDEIAQGKMVINVGMAAVRPAEFIILEFTQNVGQG